MVSKRYFFHVSGFDPYEPAAQHRRFVREVARFEATWNVTAQVSALQRSGTSESSWTVTTRAPGWQVVTAYALMDWSDIVREELKRPAVDKLHGGLSAFADLIVSGTATRYFAANWRYGMFFLVPFLNVFLFAAAALASAGFVVTAVGPRFLGVAAAVAAAIIVFSGLMRWLGGRWRVGQALADWIFARDYMLGRHARMKARVDDFAARVVECARRADVDEIVIAGHSLGATVAVDVLARAFDRDPMLGQRGPKLCFMTIGATIPKIALHPGGAWLREQTQRLADEPSLAWAEYQARDDFISFHKFDPVRLVRTEGRQSGPTIHRVQIHNMLSERTIRRFRFEYMRLHYQFVMANERRAVYDYFMLMCGPAPFRQTIAAWDGPAGLYRADGSYAGGAAGSGTQVAGIEVAETQVAGIEVPGVTPAHVKVNGLP